MICKSVKNSLNSSLLVVVLIFFFAENVFANKEGYFGKYIGKLSQLHHGVSGDVFAVDARTLHLRNFNYDGEGPAAYFYAGNSKAPGANGFRLRDERGTTGVLPKYRNKHITITLPEGKTLQNIKWFSVWCDEFSVNFGDVKIPKNLDFPKPQKINGLNGVHGVSSEPIVIVDAQTLLIPSFSYDGEAPDAKFWVGPGLKPTPQGIRIPDENGKEVPLRRYDRKTIVLTLPGELTIFDIGHFGVWCEAFTVDFGHVQIPRGLNIPPSLKMLGVSPQKRSPPIAVSLAVQNGFENQLGSQHFVQSHVNSPNILKDFNAHPKTFQDLDATTYKPPLFPTSNPAFSNNNNNNNYNNYNNNNNYYNIKNNNNYHNTNNDNNDDNKNNNNNFFEIQKSIALPLKTEFVINENSGDFVKKNFDLERSKQSIFRQEQTPAEKLLRHNPAEATNVYRNAFTYTQRSFGDPRQQLQVRGNAENHPLGQPNFQPLVAFQQQVQYDQSGSLTQQTPNSYFGKATNNFNPIFNHQNHFPNGPANSFNRFANSRPVDQFF